MDFIYERGLKGTWNSLGRSGSMSNAFINHVWNFGISLVNAQHFPLNNIPSLALNREAGTMTYLIKSQYNFQKLTNLCDLGI